MIKITKADRMDLILVVMRRMLRRWGMEGFRVYGSSPFVGNKQSIGYMTLTKMGNILSHYFHPLSQMNGI